MTGFKLTLQQMQLLIGQQFAPDQFFHPVPDINGDYFIFTNEVLLNQNPEFSWVSDLPLANYTPPPTNTII